MMRKTSRKSHVPFNPPKKSLLVVLSSPSGAGKDAVLTRMKALSYSFKYITTVTTRPQRPNERDSVDYHFVTEQRFQEMLSNNELLEWANVYGNWYGVPKQPVEQALKRDKDVIVKVDVQGAATVKNIMPQAILIFLMPPSMEELVDRLEHRHTESPFDLALRIKTAEEEIKKLPQFDYVVVNQRDKIDLAVSDLKAIITAEKCRVAPRETTL